MTSKGPGLYEFLIESELHHYFSAFKKDLKVHNIGQLKFVTDEDLTALGMSRPEIRRLKKYFQKYCPQNYISKFKKILLPRKESVDNGVILPEENSSDRSSVKVPNKHIIPAEAIVINKELGVGEFGVVQQGVWTNEEGERIQVAIKCLSKERMHSQPMEFLKEASIMHNIDSEHIVRLYGVVLDTNALMLVTELAPLRSLLECLKEPSLRDSFPVTSLCDFSVQICDGMCYLENKRLIHRDLAARNILVFTKNKVKISDFGLSRALGVGKDYYQTNFNVNLKLPIAWCAPECINYLRFTTASDVWAFGVTLWEIFSYGFQPWAALTGQQILEAIDEPHFHRLEPPEVCPKEYYAIMLKCWQHDPGIRPKFAELINVLPDLRPEQVQAVKEMEDVNTSASTKKKENLNYSVGDIIIVLDKKPINDNLCLWKGVLKNGKSGLFNPANTVAYLGTSIPSTKSAFQRGDGKNAYSSRRRLRPEMISGPQGDLKHTGHVGLDGAYFGDISFLEGKVQSNLIPQTNEKNNRSSGQKSSIYKHSPEELSTTLTRASSDVSDRAPLLKKVGEKGKFGPASERHWSDSTCEELPDSPYWNNSNSAHWTSMTSEELNHGLKNDSNDHEYHEISDDDDNLDFKKSKENDAVFQNGSFDLGPSLMDEVFRALGGSSNGDTTSNHPPGSLPPLPSLNHPQSALAPLATDDECNNVKNEIKEITSKFANKKKTAVVKAISATDERTLDSAIAMANEMASKSMLRLDGSLEGINGVEAHNGNGELPSTPSSPTKTSKFSFKFSSRHSPKQERRHFSEEAASIPDIQSSITEEAKEVYNSLVERPFACHSGSLERSESPPSSDGLDSPSHHHNPLRMLRQGMTVRPKVRGNKHNISNNFGGTLDRVNGVRKSSRGNIPSLNPNNFELTTHQTLPKGFKTKKIPPPVKPKPTQISLSLKQEDGTSQEDSGSLDSEGSANNPLPLPPRDRTKPTNTPSKSRHQRKYPLIIPGGVANSLLRGSLGNSETKTETPGRLRIQHTHNPHLEEASANGNETPSRKNVSSSPSMRVPPAKPPRLFSSLDDSFESQLACEIDALDEITSDAGGLSPIGMAPPPFSGVEGDVLCRRSLYQSSDHVSCEDLLDFALDKPNSKRTQGPSHGTQSDEVNLLLKVLKYEVTADECVETLDECNWDVHRALKLLRLQLLLPNTTYSLFTAKATLEAFGWDVTKTAAYLATSPSLEDSAQV